MRRLRLTAISLLLSGAFSAAAQAAGPVWLTDADQAFATARATGKPLLVDLYADWCGWCKVLAREVFPDPSFAEVAKGFVLLRVDVEDGGRGTELGSLYKVESLPTLLVLESSGALEGQVRGYAPVEQYVQQVKAVGTIWEKVLAAYSTSLESKDQDRLRLSAIDFYRRRDGERAAKLLERLLAVTTIEGQDGAWVRYFLADSLRMAGHFTDARSAAVRAAVSARGIADQELEERLALFDFWLARDEAKCTAAADALSRFERSHPRSELLPGAHLALDELRGGAAKCS